MVEQMILKAVTSNRQRVKVQASPLYPALIICVDQKECFHAALSLEVSPQCPTLITLSSGNKNCHAVYGSTRLHYSTGILPLALPKFRLLHHAGNKQADACSLYLHAYCNVSRLLQPLQAICHCRYPDSRPGHISHFSLSLGWINHLVTVQAVFA